MLLGLGVGVLSGLLGVGGGVLITPALHILGLPMPAAVATSLTQMVGSSLSGSYKHFKQGHVSIRLALLFGLPSLLGLVLGRHILLAFPEEKADERLSIIYLVLMAYVLFELMRKMREGSRPQVKLLPRWARFGPRLDLGPERPSVAIIPSLIAGVIVGLASSLTGLGGGFLYIPALTLLGACSIKQAIGTSLATVFLSSVFGAVIYGAAGVSNIPAALLLMLGSVVGAQLGAIAAHRAKNKRLERLFLLLVISAMVSMGLKLFAWDMAAHVLLFGSGTSIVSIALWSTFRVQKSNPLQ